MKNIKPDYKSGYYQSYYIPINPEKCKSPVVICRSLLEKRFCTYLDLNQNINSWYSEPIAIKYINKWDNKEHTYYPDFIFEANNQKVIVEVKPSNQLKHPKKPKTLNKRSIKNYNYSLKMYITNVSKFDAIRKYADLNGYKFILVTEKELKQLLN